MAFLDKLNDIAKNIGDKTSDVIETTKLSAKIMAEKKEARDELEKIGTYYYEFYAKGGQVAPEVVELCKTVKTHYDAAERFQAEIDRIKAEEESTKKKFCPVCGIEVAVDAKFCPACGEMLAK